ncbi:MAG TPA: hypothetical protein VMU30_03450, partial [Bacteroidota bacterium]|nr:hypothetical protein [Bacteroidota bacterium]
IMKHSLYVSLGILIFIFVGCTPSAYLLRPNESIAPAIKTVSLLPPKVEVFEVSAGGSYDKKDDWSQKGNDNIQAGIVTAMKKYSDIHFSILKIDSTQSIQKNILQDADALYDAVNRSIAAHAYLSSINYFHGKRENFQYAIDTSIQSLDTTADAFLLIRAKDYVASSGRTAVQVASVLVGAFAGIRVTPNSLPTEVETALIDRRTGQVIWHSMVAENGTYTLRDETAESSLFTKMFKGIPLK